MSWIITPGQLRQRSDFYHQLAQLTAAGIGLPQALQTLQRRPPSATYRRPLVRVCSQLNDGATFSEALAGVRPWLPAFEIALLQAGEQSGRLPQCFSLLADHYGGRAQLARNTLALLAYPILIFHLAFLIFPITQLQQLVLQSDATGYVLQKVAFFGPFYAVAVLAVVALQGRHGETWRGLIERCLRLVPGLGSARRCLALARLSAALEALLSAGVPIIEAWQLSARASGSPALARSVRKARHRLETGETPAEMVNANSEFPSEFAHLYHTGEVTGLLEESLKRLHVFYQEAGSRKLRTFLVAAGGMVVLLVMLTIAYQVIAFYMGYFQRIQEVIP